MVERCQGVFPGRWDQIQIFKVADLSPKNIFGNKATNHDSGDLNIGEPRQGLAALIFQGQIYNPDLQSERIGFFGEQIPVWPINLRIM